MTCLRGHLRKRCGQTDRGFTLVELLIVIVVVGMLTGAMVTGIVTSIAGTQTISQKTQETFDATLANAFLTKDAQAAGGINPATSATDTTLGVSTTDNAGCVPTGTLQIRFRWNDYTSDGTAIPTVVVYGFNAANRQLVRTICENGTSTAVALTRQVASVSVLCDGSSTCAPLPLTVQMTLTASNTPPNQPTPFVTTLTASLRPQSKTAPTGGTGFTALAPVVALGPASCADGPALQITGNSEFEIDGGRQILVGSPSPGCVAMDVSGSSNYDVPTPPAIYNGGTCNGCVPAASAGTGTLADPLAPLAARCTNPVPSTNPSRPWAPGADGILVFPQALNVTSDFSFPPGVYIFCGGLTVNGGAEIGGSQATFYAPTGTITLNGGSEISTFRAIVARRIVVSGNSEIEMTPNVGGLSITTTSLPNATAGVAYSETVVGTGGTTPYIWSATGLGNGLSIDSATGVISGMPTAGPSLNVVVTLEDATGLAVSRALPISMVPPPSITTTSLTAATQNTSYSFNVVRTGGTAPYTWSATGLPSGLSIGATTGTISGTPTVSGTFSSVIVTVEDANGLTATRTFSLLVNPGPPSITTTSLPSGTLNRSYSQTIQWTGGAGPVTVTRSAGNLPNGLGISPAGVISGTPTATGTFNFTVQVRENNAPNRLDTQALSIRINPAPSIPGQSFEATAGTAFSDTLSGADGTTPYTWAISGGPSWLSVNPANGDISGTPPSSGTVTFNATLTDANGAVATRNSIQITVNAAPQITTSSLANGTQNQSYTSVTMSRSNGTAPFTWSATGLPAGMNMSSGGTISGTPSVSGSFSVVVTLTDGNGAVVTRTLPLSIAPAAPVITTTSVPQATAGRAYSTTIAWNFGQGPFTFSISSGSLPSGLGISNLGVISGTTTQTGPRTFTVRIDDNLGRFDTQSITMQVNSAPSIPVQTLNTGTVSAAYSDSVSASGGTGSLAWSMTGAPSWLNLNPANGALSGTPTAVGSVSVTFTVTDDNGATASRALSIPVNAAPSITAPASLPARTAGVPYPSTSFTGSDGVPNYSWSATGLPNGLNMSNGGTLSGTPTTAGTFNPVIRITDANGATATRTYSITIHPAVVIDTTSLPQAVQGRAYSATVTASGGSSTPTITITGLSNGLTASGATISGTPTSTSTVNVTVSATDGTGGAASRSLSITVNPPLAVNTAALNSWTAGRSGYSFTPSTGGGIGPRTVTAVSGLPAGLTFSNGQITGTPTSAGTVSNISITVQDAAGVSVTRNGITMIVNPALALANRTLTPTDGRDFSVTATATGGTPGYTWGLSGNPGSMSISSGGTITWNNPPQGTRTVTVTVTDAAGAQASATYTFNVAAQVQITTTSLSSCTRTFCSRPVNSSGGAAPLTWSISQGSLPSGMSINTSTGVISGTPAQTGTSNFRVRVEDANGDSDTQNLSIQVN